jgi:hypothetical protein
MDREKEIKVVDFVILDRETRLSKDSLNFRLIKAAIDKLQGEMNNEEY